MAYHLKTFLLVLIIALSSNNGMAETTWDGNLSTFPGNPSYTVYSYSDYPVVNPGDNISISLFVPGVGDVDYNKLDVSIPPYIVKNNKIRVTYTSNNMGIKNLKYLDEESHFGLVLYKEWFMADADGLTNRGDVFHYDSNDGKRYAPLTFEFDIADNAPAGDHTISAVLFYKNGVQWYMYEKSIIVHIRYWQEEHPYQYAGLVALIGAVIVASASFIWNYTAKWVKRPVEPLEGSKLEHLHP